MAISKRILCGWNNQLSEAILKVGTPEFPNSLVSSLRQLVDFDLCMVFAYGEVEGSVSLHYDMPDDQAAFLVKEYLTGPHLLDPFFEAATSGKVSGFNSMRELAPDQFYRSEFYRHHYVRTRIADEMGIFFPVGHGRIAVLSITRQKPKGLFSEVEKEIFQSTALLVEALGSNHWGDSPKDIGITSSSIKIKQVFDRFGENVLTQREREIITLVLKGHSSFSIGLVLGIAPGTVKIHRKNAYKKLTVSSQAELFALFLSSLEVNLKH
ncbi:MAG: helix-turn-helix transcriptional regulator [Granulosicoccus sp.]